MNRGITEIQATSKDPTKQYQSFIKRIPLDTKPNIDYLSAILANPIKSNHKNIQRNNRLRFQKKEIQEFRKICKNVNNLQDNNEFLKSKKQYILKKYFGEFPKISTSNISYDDVKPLILLCKDNFKFTLQYEYFESFINICNLNTKFNKPLSLLHLNLYTHWIDACFIAKYFPHHLCIYSGLYLKSLYCNKGFNTLLKNFFNHKLMNALKDIGSYFFTILPNNILKNYYSSCKENEVLMNFLNHPKENTFIYEEENTYYHNCWEPPTSNFSSHPLVELYDWILEMENEEDINYLYKIYNEQYTADTYSISISELLSIYYKEFPFEELSYGDKKLQYEIVCKCPLTPDECPYETYKACKYDFHIDECSKFFNITSKKNIFDYIEPNKLYLKLKDEE